MTIKSDFKLNKIWVDGKEFYNEVMKKWLKKINIVMYSMQNEGKSEMAEKITRVLKNKLNWWLIK